MFSNYTDPPNPLKTIENQGLKDIKYEICNFDLCNGYLALNGSLALTGLVNLNDTLALNESFAINGSVTTMILILVISAGFNKFNNILYWL